MAPASLCTFTYKLKHHQAIWKRKVSALRQLDRIDAAVDELIKYLDTFYIDPEGWLELADMYSSCSLYICPIARSVT